MRLVEDNPSSLSLVEIYKQRCAKKGIEHDNPISRYYDRLATVQARGTQASHQVLERTMNCNQRLFLRPSWFYLCPIPSLRLPFISLDVRQVFTDPTPFEEVLFCFLGGVYFGFVKEFLDFLYLVDGLDYLSFKKAVFVLL